MKTNYPGHDAVYKKHKVEGKDGWDTSPEITRENITLLEKALQAEYVPKKAMC